MIRLLTLLTILTCVGCQTAPKQEKNEISPKKEVITVLVEHSEILDSQYKISVRWSEFKSDGTEQVLTCPQNTRKPNEWHTLRIGTRYENFIPAVSYLISDEMINLKPVNGVNLISKITPNAEQNVQAQGIIAVSWTDKTGKLINRSVPFDVNCKLNEPKIVYENEIKLEPVN